jgi:quinoprotein glucose dehydrogenase
VFGAVLTRVLTGLTPDRVKTEVLVIAREWQWKELSEPAFALVKNQQVNVKTRVAALEFLGATAFPRLSEAVNAVSESSAEELRIAAIRLATKSMRGDKLLAVFEKLLSSGTLRERQNVYALLGDVKDPAAGRLLVRQLDDLLLGRIAGEVQLDLVEAAARRSEAPVKEKLGQVLARRASKDGVAQFTDCLAGGDADNGRKIFRENVQASCVRCHKIAGDGGDAAPDLTHIATRGNRTYILESITFPNAKIAPGFESAQVVLKNGTSAAGIVKRDTDEALDLFSLEDGLVTIRKVDISSRTKAMSGMLDNLREVLTRRQIRDLVEYLSKLQ